MSQYQRPCWMAPLLCLLFLVVCGGEEDGALVGNNSDSEEPGGYDGPPRELFADQFDTEPTDWKLLSWEVFDSSVAYVSNYCIGAEYSSIDHAAGNRRGSATIMKGFDLYPYSSGTLNFFSKMGTDATTDTNFVRVYVQANQEHTETVWETPIQQADWNQISIDISEYCGVARDFRIAFEWFYFEQGSAIEWYIDNVQFIVE